MKDERVTSLDGPWVLQSGTIPAPTRARVRAEGGMRQATLLSARSTPNQTGPGRVLISEIVPNPESFGTFPFPLPPARAGALSSFLSLAAYRRPLAELGRLLLCRGHRHRRCRAGWNVPRSLSRWFNSLYLGVTAPFSC